MSFLLWRSSSGVVAFWSFGAASASPSTRLSPGHAIRRPSSACTSKGVRPLALPSQLTPRPSRQRPRHAVLRGAHHARRISRSERPASRRHSNSALLCHRRDMSNRTDWPVGLNAFLPRPLAATADSFLVHNKNRGSSYGEPSRAFWLPSRPAAVFAPNFTCCSCVLLSPSPSF